MFLQAVTAKDLLRAMPQLLTHAIEVLDHRLILIHLHRGDRGSQRMCLRAMRRGQQKHALFLVLEAAELHELALARQGRQREPVG